MPTSVRVARILMCLQLAPALFVFAIMLPLLMGGVSPVPALLAVGLCLTVGVVVFGLRSRRPWVRWMGVVIENALAVVVR